MWLFLKINSNKLWISRFSPSSCLSSFLPCHWHLVSLNRSSVSHAKPEIKVWFWFTEQTATAAKPTFFQTWFSLSPPLFHPPPTDLHESAGQQGLLFHVGPLILPHWHSSSMCCQIPFYNCWWTLVPPVDRLHMTGLSALPTTFQNIMATLFCIMTWGLGPKLYKLALLTCCCSSNKDDDWTMIT